jgi:predicted enzyme related to lactoylglutathione lyase
VAWFEIIIPERELANKFSADLFGWKVVSDPLMGDYSLVDTQSGEGAVAVVIGPADP